MVFVLVLGSFCGVVFFNVFIFFSFKPLLSVWKGFTPATGLDFGRFREKKVL